MMVSAASIAFMLLSLLISGLGPILLSVWLYRRLRFSIRALLVGVMIFLVSQVFLRIPGLQILAQTAWYRGLTQNPWLLGLFLGLTAGIFEEVGRWLGLRYLVKKQWQTKNGIAYGIGHGGIEAILFSGLTMLNNLIISLMINGGTYDQIASQVGPTAAETIRRNLVETPAYLFGVSGLERAATMVVHIALSLVVLEAVRRARPLYLVIAILLHGLLNAPLAVLMQLPNPYLWSELWVLAGAVVSFLYIRRMWKADQAVQPPDGVQPA